MKKEKGHPTPDTDERTSARYFALGADMPPSANTVFQPLFFGFFQTWKSLSPARSPGLPAHAMGTASLSLQPHWDGHCARLRAGGAAGWDQGTFPYEKKTGKQREKWRKNSLEVKSPFFSESLTCLLLES